MRHAVIKAIGGHGIRSHHLGYFAGTTSAPFPAGEHNQIAVKVIDPRGNELLVVKQLKD